METAPGPIFELTCRVEREDVLSFESWLARHAEEMLERPGITGVEVYQQADDEAGRARRIVHYCFENDLDLEQFRATCEPANEAAIGERFGASVETSQRILRHAPIAEDERYPVATCLNCGAVLGGQYCGQCGQRATSRLISVWELLRDAFGDLLEMDSRLWRTLIPLLVRPGRLTRDYLEGRRARYMPPFRTYLVLSIVFFIVAFFDPREELGILFEPPAPPPPVAAPGDTPAVPGDTAAEAESAAAPAGETAGIVIGTPGVGGAEDAQEKSGQFEIRFSSEGDVNENCDVEDIDTSEWPAWLSSRLTEERLLATCNRIVADDGTAFVRKLLDNVPAALFLLLPLMALVLKVLYPLSKRYYVEHLLFVVHYHAFVFLILSLQVVFVRLTTLVGLSETASEVTVLAASLYVPVYLYKSLRRVYGQGRLFTLIKFAILVLAYFTGLLFVFGVVALYAAFSL